MTVTTDWYMKQAAAILAQRQANAALLLSDAGQNTDDTGDGSPIGTTSKDTPSEENISIPEAPPEGMAPPQDPEA